MGAGIHRLAQVLTYLFHVQWPILYQMYHQKRDISMCIQIVYADCPEYAFHKLTAG